MEVQAETRSTSESKGQLLSLDTRQIMKKGVRQEQRKMLKMMGQGEK